MITTQATPHPSGLWTVLGLARLTYAPAGLTLEVVALHQYMQEIVRPAADHPRSVEGLATRIAVDASAAVGVPVAVELVLLVRPWQVLRVRA